MHSFDKKVKLILKYEYIIFLCLPKPDNLDNFNHRRLTNLCFLHLGDYQKEW
jgi:hypothetical protein